MKIPKFPFGGKLNHVVGPRPQIARDAYGRELHVGDEIVLSKPVLSRFLIADIKPLSLDPAVPQNTIAVALQMTLIMKVGADLPTPEILQVRSRPEITATEGPTTSVGEVVGPDPRD